MSRKKLVSVYTTLLFLVMAILNIELSANQLKAKKAESVKIPENLILENIPPIPLEIKKKMKQYTELRATSFEAWDPRGKGMIVSTRTGNTSQICWLESPLAELKQMTHFNEPVTNAYFSPNPKKKYFLFRKDIGGGENHQIYQFDLKTGQSKRITDGKSRHFGITFNHRGDQIAFLSNQRSGSVFDLFVMDPEKPKEIRLVYKGEQTAFYMPSAWLYDDQHLLLVKFYSANEAKTLLLDTQTGKAENLTPKSDKKLYFVLSAASKDGKYFYGVSDQGNEFQQLIRYERSSKRIKILTEDIPWNVDTLTPSIDMKKIAFLTNEGGINRLYLLNPYTLKYQPLRSIPEGIISDIEFDQSGEKIFMNISNARMNLDAFHLELATSKLVQWTRDDSTHLDLSNFSLPQLIHYPTFDQVEGKPRRIPAFYYKPPQKIQQPYPVLIYIHGGPESQINTKFKGVLNYYINELGIAVICPNVRGSNGYGKSFLLLDNGKKREDSVKDIGAILDWINTQPEFDKDRIAVMGGSYGGYMTLATMVHYADRLACGVDIVGISNFVSFLKNTSPYRRDLRRVEYGDERVIGDFLNKISPLTNAHKIKKPLLVIQGKNDPRVPISEAEQIVRTVKKNNIPVWYMVGENEGHGFRKKDNRDFMYYTLVRFLQEFLIKEKSN